MTEAAHKALDTTLHCTVAAYAVAVVLGGLFVTTGWRY